MHVTVLTQPNHPARLAALFASALAACGVIALAAYAAAWMWHDERSEERTSRVAGISASPADNVKAPEGLMIVIPVDSAGEFEALTGFAPFIPERVPSSNEPAPKLAVTQPDETGARMGRVAFSAKRDSLHDGVSGPVIVISQARGKAGDGVDGVLKRMQSTRALVATFPCGDLVLDVQLYFSPEPAAGEEIVTPWMRSVGEGFVGDLKDQCAQR